MHVLRMHMAPPSRILGLLHFPDDMTAPLLQICPAVARRRNLLGNFGIHYGCAEPVNSTSIGLGLSTMAGTALYSRTGPLTALKVPTTPGEQASGSEMISSNRSDLSTVRMTKLPH